MMPRTALPCCRPLSFLHCLQEVPQALRSKPHDVFGSRIAALQQLGIDADTLKSVVGRSTVFLTTKGAPQEQLAFLKEELGFSTVQVGCCCCDSVAQHAVRACVHPAAHVVVGRGGRLVDQH